ncbi:hypothetical protein [Streptomyces sp. B22F1]|uniref:hypothetical protein n=1 Tax=Streptomyces sp. B22F1 TaxID=3153566 RepID=UPI00325F6726
MLFADLCDTLNKASSWPGLQSGDYGVREERSSNPNYELPEVREVRSSAPLTPALMLVTAPAAVGKSTAAEYMSNTLRAPILDLSKLQVGDSTLAGALAKSLGGRKNAEFTEALEASAAVLIIDALDEAEVRSGQANFRAFLRGVADAASQVQGGRPAIVIFSRAESARPLVEVFDDRRVPYAHYEIRSFGKAAAENYLDNRMVDVFTTHGKDALHRKHRKPFAEARDALFAALASAVVQDAQDIWENADIRDFLGYAPVLDVMAEYLAVDNFNSVATTLTVSPSGEFGRWRLVADVIDQLMIREQKKFTNQFVEIEDFQRHGNRELEAVLYTPEEQCGRLLDYVENMTVALDVPILLPNDLRESYEAAVNVQLSNHPFLRGDGWFNVVFRDYVTARAQFSPLTSKASSSQIRKKLLSVSWKHSPMYAFFSHALGLVGSSGVSACHSEDLGALYESLKSMCEAEDQLNTSIGRHGNRLAAMFSITRKDSESIASMTFSTHESTTSVTFPRELSHTTIWEVPEVILGGDHDSFKFGSHVYISCSEMLISTKEIRVYSPDDGAPTLINAKVILSDDLKIHAKVEDFLVISEEDLAFPWSGYQQRLDLGSAREDGREARLLYLEIRRIVLRFKDAKDGEAAVFQPFMDNLVIGNNARARGVLDFLISVGCINTARSMYLLDLQEFAKFGVSRAQLRDAKVTSASVKLSFSVLHFTKAKREGS